MSPKYLLWHFPLSSDQPLSSMSTITSLPLRLNMQSSYSLPVVTVESPYLALPMAVSMGLELELQRTGCKLSSSRTTLTPHPLPTMFSPEVPFRPQDPSYLWEGSSSKEFSLDLWEGSSSEEFSLNHWDRLPHALAYSQQQLTGECKAG